ncbi:hypothetical protein GW17_00045183, partial [Ensete ventricosum]
PQLKPVGSLSLHETPNSPPSGSLALTLSLSPASSMMDGGTSAGGDGFLSPICIFLLVVALQTLDGLLELVKRSLKYGDDLARSDLVYAYSTLLIDALSYAIVKASRIRFSSPSSSFSLPRLISLEIDRRRSKSIVTVQQRPETVEIDRYRSISGGNSPSWRYRPVAGGPRTCQLADWYVPPGSRWSTYRSAGGPVHTAQYGQPSTFAQSAKLRRLAAAKEKELQKSM